MKIYKIIGLFVIFSKSFFASLDHNYDKERKLSKKIDTRGLV